MKLFRRLTALFLAVICIFALLSIPGAAQQKTSDDDAQAKTPAAETSNAETGNDKLIALTFDDGPSSNTKKLLDGLRQRGVHCTFFVVGQYAKIYPATIKQHHQDGTDWTTLKLVFTRFDKQWYLTALIHGEWTP